MKKPNGLEKLREHWLLDVVCATILVAFVLSALIQPAQAQELKPPAVPANIQAPAGNKLFLASRAVGTQNYICLPADGTFKFILFTPQATLFKEQKQIATHYFSPNPFEGGTLRATWQHAKDTSTVWGKVADGNSSTDPAYVAPGAIPWLLVTITGAQAGPDDSDKLAATTYIQRINTAGGVAPTTGCAVPADVGTKAFVPYTTDYLFYKKAN